MNAPAEGFEGHLNINAKVDAILGIIEGINPQILAKINEDEIIVIRELIRIGGEFYGLESLASVFLENILDISIGLEWDDTPEKIARNCLGLEGDGEPLDFIEIAATRHVAETHISYCLSTGNIPNGRDDLSPPRGGRTGTRSATKTSGSY